MEKDKKGNSLLAAGVAEIVIVAVLIIAILGTLNYFAILPLSRTFPFLSFLPRQSTQVKPQTQDNQGQETRTNQNQGQLANVRQVIIPSDIKTFTNSTGEYNPIKDGYIKIEGPIRINVQMGIDIGPSSQEASDGSGLVFGNGLANSIKDLRSVSILYSPQYESWILHYYYGEKQEFFYLLSMPTSEVYGGFSLLISGNGRQATVTLPNFDQKTFNLPDSLYTTTNLMHTSIKVATGQTVTVSSLNYQY